AKTATTADPATATLFKEAEFGDSVGEPPGAAAMDGGEAAPEGDDAGVSEVGGAGGDANGESDAVVGAFAGATIGGVDVVGGGVTTGGDATGAGELFGDAPGACEKADPAINANIRAMITFGCAILAFKRKVEEAQTEEEMLNMISAKTATTADPATATLFKEAELGDSVGEPPGAAAMDGGEAAPEGDDAGVSTVGGAGGDADGEDAVVGAFAGATIGGVDVVGGGGVATGAGELFGEAAGDAPGACAKADPATNANIRAIITFEYAIIVFKNEIFE
ncbi:hypothetical protein H5410_063095, partial [Solanum commersonii]